MSGNPSSSNPSLFRPIGEIAESTQALPDEIQPVQEDGNGAADPLRQQVISQEQLTTAQAEADRQLEEEGDEREVQQIESLCMECGEQGMTRMLLTVIPYFREVIVMSFRCEHCGNSNTEIQSAGEIQPKGCIHTVHVLDSTDLDRQLVKSGTATVMIPELQLTIPASRGQLTNIEGLVRDTVRDLGMDQSVRKVMDVDAHDKIQAIIDRLSSCLDEDDDDEANEAGVKKPAKVFQPFTLTLDDPAGNSFIQFRGTTGDARWSMRVYNRTKAQNVMLGLVAADDAGADAQATDTDQPADKRKVLQAAADDLGANTAALMDRLGDGTVVPEEVYAFPGSCSSCGHQIDTLMQKVNIPHFKDIIIMSTNCEHCGYRDNEVKSGGAISEKGKKIVLKMEDEEDLSRDILKIPEIDLVLQPGTLGGRFTTIEGMLNQIYDELSTKVFRTGDSSVKLADGEKSEFEKFLGDLKDVMTVARPFTLILDDPVSNSYLQNLFAPDDDPNMEIITYERTHDQNEELGLNDMVLEGYEKDEEKETEATK